MPATSDIYTLSLHDALPICDAEVALCNGSHKAVAEAFLALQLLFVPRLEGKSFELDDLDELVIFRQQGFAVVMREIRDEAPQPVLLGLRFAARRHRPRKPQCEASQGHNSSLPTPACSRPCQSARSRSTTR